MPIVPLLDVGEGYKSRTVSAQKRTNLYVELQQNADKASIVMYGTPGLTAAVNLGAEPVRGAYGIGDFAYVVSGNTLYMINNAGIYSVLGTINSSTGRVSISDNGTQMIIVDGVSGYILDLGSLVLNTIPSP